MSTHIGPSPDRPVEDEGRRLVWGRLTLLVLVVTLGAVVAALVGLPDAEQLRADVAAMGRAAPALFILLYAVATLAPLPKNVLSAAAGLLFGLVEGLVVVLLGALLGALAAFALGRALGRDAVERLTGARVARVDALLGRYGLLAVLGVRLVPVLPFTAINYAAGLTAVRIRDYVIGTALGIIPGTVAYVALGAYGTSPGSWPFVVAVLALVVLTAGGAVAARRYRRRGRVPESRGHLRRRAGGRR
ncbi:TVP38/TMEM64 family protein [Blastococcus capsensis]|uniref:TVP38/TMEM64 family protein n=1 Tax=Blastococcus capsensis TaxID=1564163 RepID=UPI0025419627|nr:TVP38/TMEM64 family protein [Blastococcus capsensis]MDK3257367.1 TVP38/TMEM64 family protein [Blastococcus capsensis]